MIVLLILINCAIINRQPQYSCTPGRVNPILTKVVICAKSFRTGKYRNSETSEKQKEQVYQIYGIAKPQHNRGKQQQCELDHLVPLELGGADSLDNIWPQCGDFRTKDKVETALHRAVCSGAVDLGQAQQAISEDWQHALDLIKKSK